MRFAWTQKEWDVRGHRRQFRYLDHPGSVAILAVRGRTIALVRQLRPAIGSWIWEIPAGTLDPGEAPEQAAARELEEETGWRAGVLRELASFYLAPGYSSERMHLFAAARLEQGQRRLDEGEAIAEPQWVTPEALTAMVRSGEIQDAKSLAALAFTGQALALGSEL